MKKKLQLNKMKFHNFLENNQKIKIKKLINYYLNQNMKKTPIACYKKI